MLTPPRHLIPSLVYHVVRVCPPIFVLCFVKQNHSFDTNKSTLCLYYYKYKALIVASLGKYFIRRIFPWCNCKTLVYILKQPRLTKFTFSLAKYKAKTFFIKRAACLMDVWIFVIFMRFIHSLFFRLLILILKTLAKTYINYWNSWPKTKVVN